VKGGKLWANHMGWNRDTKRRKGASKYTCLYVFVVKGKLNTWILAFLHWIWPLKTILKFSKCEHLFN
jgi:hypothetical protein